jgi:hypothetical protein
VRVLPRGAGARHTKWKSAEVNMGAVFGSDWALDEDHVIAGSPINVAGHKNSALWLSNDLFMWWFKFGNVGGRRVQIRGAAW